MKTSPVLFILTVLLAFFFSIASYGINTEDTRMLSQPAISAKHIAFIYAEDLWVANADGTQARRLTADSGVESDPCFSPDGRTIAFNAQYDGNTDVYTIPVDGGIPVRLTFHPGEDLVKGFTPDGRNILFSSQQAVFSIRLFELFTVGIDGGFPVKLKIPNGWSASYSPDGKYLAYTPHPPFCQQWKDYRGGKISQIWICSLADFSIEKIPQPDGGCNDTDPMWAGDKIYFLSDRNGEFNLFSWSLSGKETTQLTAFNDFPASDASFGDDMIIFGQSGYLHCFDTKGMKEKRLVVPVAADLPELRPRYVRGMKYIRDVDISPTGSRIVMDFRGDIITLPAEKGDPRNLTTTPGVHEKNPAWSPDGRSIAYFSDDTGEYMLHIMPQDGKGYPKCFRLNGTGFYSYPEWSPDSRKIAFTDNGRNLYILEISSGNITKVDSDNIYSPEAFRNIFGDWSSDSKWIVYTKLLETNFQEVLLYSLDNKVSYQVTDGLSHSAEPRFDPDGRYLYFFASTDAGPVLSWFDLSALDMRMTSSIYLVALRKDILSPLARESDEEQTETGKQEPVSSTPGKKKNSLIPAQEKSAVPELKIDTDGLSDRIIALPVAAGNYSDLSVGNPGELFFIARPIAAAEKSKLHRFNLKEKKDEEIAELEDYIISADRKKMYYSTGSVYGITETGNKPAPDKGILDISAIAVKIDPVAEWSEILDEAWRINRDYFYDPGMHGVDWNALREKYRNFLPDLACRSDLNKVIQLMLSELRVGHSYILDPGDRFNTSKKIGVGLLGADYKIVSDRYRIEKIYGGLNWNPELRSPLTEPGLNIREGDYILAVNGRELTSAQNIFSYFENLDGKITELTINDRPVMAGSRVVKTVPVANEYSLRNRDWVEGNLRKVTEESKGQVAYIYVPNTSTEGHDYFKRYFFPQVKRKAVIIDERFNGGGFLADYYVDILMRPLQAYWNMRYGKDLKTPTASIQGPRVMIINEAAFSGGDFLPWMFRKFGMGTLVGKRTAGGLVGFLETPVFIDGGAVTAPNLAVWTKDGFIIENAGIAPDIEVEQLPSDIINGKDPQLEKAIEVALKELANNPPEEPVRPGYPVKVKK